MFHKQLICIGENANECFTTIIRTQRKPNSTIIATGAFFARIFQSNRSMIDFFCIEAEDPIQSTRELNYLFCLLAICDLVFFSCKYLNVSSNKLMMEHSVV